jgi:lysophospholipase
MATGLQVPKPMSWVRLILLGIALAAGVVAVPARAVDEGYDYARCAVQHALISTHAARAEARRRYLAEQFGEGKRPASTSEKNLLTDMHERVLPFIAEKGVKGSFAGVDGVQISYSKFENPKEKGAIIISHGFGENINYYPELIFNLYERGYSVYFIEHRGHGGSQRLIDKSMPVFVSNFEHYAEDMNTFIDQVVKAKPHAKTVLLGHSMGGLVGTLQTKMYPGKIDKLILSAPLFGPDLRGLPHFLAEAVANVATVFGFGGRYAFGQTERPHMKNGFEKNIQTTSRPRFYQKWRTFQTEPIENRNSGATFGWLAAAIGGCRTGRCAGPDIDVPVLVFKAGLERVVHNKSIDIFCKGVSDCRVHTFPDAKHDIPYERDEVRDVFLTKIFEFIEGPATAQKPADAATYLGAPRPVETNPANNLTSPPVNPN